jgi:hypothetical protein
MRQHPKFVMVMDTLYKIPAFVKFVDATLSDNKNRHSSLKAHDMMHYISAPLYRLNVYNKAIRQLRQYSDPAHPDYNNLLHVSQKFKSLESEWSEK